MLLGDANRVIRQPLSREGAIPPQFFYVKSILVETDFQISFLQSYTARLKNPF